MTLGFTGEQIDPTGLLYLRAAFNAVKRMLSARLRSFIQHTAGLRYDGNDWSAASRLFYILAYRVHVTDCIPS